MKPGSYWLSKERVLGVLGLSPYATIDFLRKLADETPARKDWEHIRVLMDMNTKIPSRGRALDLGEEDPTAYMNKAIIELSKNGADLVVIPCNTSHYFYDGFVKDIDVPVFSIIQVTSEYIRQNHPEVKKVGVMASLNTVKHRLYNKYLDSGGIVTVYPEDQAEVSKIIEEVKIGNDNKDTVDRAMKVAKDLTDIGAQGIILGCTEIPSVIDPEKLTVPVFDTNKILSQACISFIHNK